MMIVRERGIERERDERLTDDLTVSVDDEGLRTSGASAEDIEFERQMRIARDVMRDHRAVLAALAK